MAAPATRAHDIWVRLLLYPGHTLPTAVAPVLVGTGLALHDGVFAVLPAALAFLGSWLIHVGGVLLDNHELLRRHGAVVEHPELTAAVRDGTLRLPVLRLAIVACFLLALVPGGYLVAIGGTLALLLGAVGVLASAGYAWGRFAYARLGLADPLFFAMFGVVAVLGTWFSQAASHLSAPPTLAEAWRLLPRTAFVVGLPVGALVTAVLVVDDVRDVDQDREKGWRTPAVRFGTRASRWEFAGLLAFACLLPVGFWPWLGPSVLLPLLTLPWAWRAARTVLTAERAALVPMTPRVAKLAAVHALLLAIGLASAG